MPGPVGFPASRREVTGAPSQRGSTDPNVADSTTRALVERIRTRLIATRSVPTPARVAEALREEGLVLGDRAVLDLVGSLRAVLAGAGPLEPLLRLPDVTDVLVNGPDSVWIDRGNGLERSEVQFADEAAVRTLAQRLSAAAGKRLDDASPFVDARLPDGCRLHAVIPPIVPRGTTISLRVPLRRGFSVTDLVQVHTIEPSLAEILISIVKRRLAFLVSGGTGVGKTTVLSALLAEVPPQERIVVVEDSGELSPRHPHVVALEGRQPNVEGFGAVSLRDLVRQALRMRPDRLVVGEVRGAEVVDLLMALNTGHEGGCGTVHANSAGDVPVRLESLALAVGLPRPAIQSQIAAGIDVVVHLRRDEQGRRTVAQIAVLQADAEGMVQIQPALEVHRGAIKAGPGADQLEHLLGSS